MTSESARNKGQGRNPLLDHPPRVVPTRITCPSSTTIWYSSKWQDVHLDDGDYLSFEHILVLSTVVSKSSSLKMEALIKTQLNGKEPSEVIELQLDNCDALAIEGLTDEFSNLVILALNGNALSTLKGLPKLESLMSIDLSDNKLSASLDVLVKRCPQLTHVNLSGNDIKEIEKLLPLKNLANLVCLDVMDCPLEKTAGYPKKVFEIIPNLEYLNGLDVNGEEDEEDSSDDVVDEESDDEEVPN
uniref:Uncharacterized protein n=1 Tax=Ditylenchus dipsaci TaxID=166011 RepID=A0A915CSD5_9BILA